VCGCEHEPMDCDDNNACTTDYCDPNNGCYSKNRSECCDDGNACTTDSCDPILGCFEYSD
jgi:hypothetical protein